ncbi:MAG: hypothetical protein QOJ19_7, partial [Acidimicrobiia bacterium]|nr:hypothetical protein [Acidimicrobiia bacterium]
SATWAFVVAKVFHGSGGVPPVVPRRSTVSVDRVGMGSVRRSYALATMCWNDWFSARLTSPSVKTHAPSLVMPRAANSAASQTRSEGPPPGAPVTLQAVDAYQVIAQAWTGGALVVANRRSGARSESLRRDRCPRTHCDSQLCHRHLPPALCGGSYQAERLGYVGARLAAARASATMATIACRTCSPVVHSSEKPRRRAARPAGLTAVISKP